MEALPQTSFLGRLSPADREALQVEGTVRTYPDSAYLLREGDPPSFVAFVLRGTVKLTKVATTGREVLLELRGPGDIVGELGAIDAKPRSANAVALGELEVLTVSHERFTAWASSNPGIARQLLLTIVQRLRDASARQLELGAIDVVGRVCRRLLELAASHGELTADGLLIRSAISQQELAEWAGVSRDGVVRTLQELRAGGVVDTGRQRVLIRDLAVLRGRAGA
jgi:CRP/FNR family transcriptional regulator, cyclic AMP receptor protein